jgi:hypothetical protein
MPRQPPPPPDDPRPPSPPPQELAKVLAQLFAMRGYGRIQGDRQLQEIWREIAGPELSKGTRAMTIRGGILQIGVTNHALLSELVSFHKTDLLARLKEKHPQLKVRELKFKKWTKESG